MTGMSLRATVTAGCFEFGAFIVKTILAAMVAAVVGLGGLAGTARADHWHGHGGYGHGYGYGYHHLQLQCCQPLCLASLIYQLILESHRHHFA